jgi:hypothetical protein
MKLNLQLFLAFVFALIFANTINATTYTATTGGYWSLETWSPAGTPGPGDDVIIPDGITDTIDVNFTIHNLTIGGGASGQIRMSATTSIAFVLTGNLTINTGATFSTQNNRLGGTNTGLWHTLDLQGNITNNGTFTPRSGSATATPKTINVVNITLSGSSNSTLFTSAIPAGGGSNANMFNLLTINKTGGAKVILTSNWVMSGGSSTPHPSTQSGLVLTSGILETGSYYFAVLSTTDTLVRGYSASSYVNGCLGRGMSNSAGASNKKFPVGDVNGYQLVSVYINQPGTNSTGHCVFVRCIPGTPNITSISGGGIDKVSAVRYYKVSYGNIGAGTTTMIVNHFRPSYNYTDGVSTGNTDLRVAYSTDSMATWKGVPQTYPHSSSLTTLPRQIAPDTLLTPITLTAGSTSFFVALARNTGTTANSLNTSVVLYSRSIIDGFYNSVINKMVPDVITIELHDATSPYNLVDSQNKSVDSNGICYATFSTAVKNTNYYIVIKHRNAVETWSAAGVSFPDSSRQNYDFTSAQTQAYGSNLALNGSKWCLFNGDENQDGSVDGTDLGDVDNDNNAFVTGYTPTDLNGDDVVDGTDLGLVDNNNNAFVAAVIPTGAPNAIHLKRPSHK